MDNGRTGRRPGLLVMRITVFRALIVFLLLYAPALYPQNTTEPRVTLRLNPESPYAGQEWTLTLLIDHPDPREVTVIPPDFSGSFFLDRVFTSVRLIPEGDTPGKWTETEYRIISHNPGSFIIGRFTVVTPGSRISTAPFTLIVRNAGPDTGAVQPRLEWVNAPSRLHIGETGIVNLTISGWDPGVPLPGSHVFMPPLNESFIMESQPPDISNGVLRLHIAPLALHDLDIPARTVVYNTVKLEIPALRVQVAPRSVPDQESAGAVTRTPQAPAFPEFELPLSAGFFPRLLFGIGRFRADYESVYHAAADLFAQERYAEALGLLRRHERDHAAFPLFAAARRQAESNIGVYNTRNEKPRKFNKILYLFLCAVVLVFYALFFARKTGKKSILAFGICAAGVGYWLAGGQSFSIARPTADFPRGVSRTAVVREAELRQIPDFSGEPFIRLKAGQPVRARGAKETENTVHTGWVWIITNDTDRMSGWIPEDKTVYY